MSAARSRVRTALKLQAIEHARRTAAELALTAARRTADEARRSEQAANAALSEAEAAWAEQLNGQCLDLDLQRISAGQVLDRETLSADR